MLLNNDMQTSTSSSNCKYSSMLLTIEIDSGRFSCIALLPYVLTFNAVLIMHYHQYIDITHAIVYLTNM